jgi:hypothetical protein
MPTTSTRDLATRRRILQTSAVGFGHLAFRALLDAEVLAETAAESGHVANPLADVAAMPAGVADERTAHGARHTHERLET